jgi:hypothetical protein
VAVSVLQYAGDVIISESVIRRVTDELPRRNRPKPSFRKPSQMLPSWSLQMAMIESTDEASSLI